MGFLNRKSSRVEDQPVAQTFEQGDLEAAQRLVEFLNGIGSLKVSKIFPSFKNKINNAGLTEEVKDSLKTKIEEFHSANSGLMDKTEYTSALQGLVRDHFDLDNQPVSPEASENFQEVSPEQITARLEARVDSTNADTKAAEQIASDLNRDAAEVLGLEDVQETVSDVDESLVGVQKKAGLFKRAVKAVLGYLQSDSGELSSVKSTSKGEEDDPEIEPETKTPDSLESKKSEVPKIQPKKQKSKIDKALEYKPKTAKDDLRVAMSGEGKKQNAELASTEALKEKLGEHIDTLLDFSLASVNGKLNESELSKKIEGISKDTKIDQNSIRRVYDLMILQLTEMAKQEIQAEKTFGKSAALAGGKLFLYGGAALASSFILTPLGTAAILGATRIFDAVLSSKKEKAEIEKKRRTIAESLSGKEGVSARENLKMLAVAMLSSEKRKDIISTDALLKNEESGNLKALRKKGASAKRSATVEKHRTAYREAVDELDILSDTNFEDRIIGIIGQENLPTDEAEKESYIMALKALYRNEQINAFEDEIANKKFKLDKATEESGFDKKLKTSAYMTAFGFAARLVPGVREVLFGIGGYKAGEGAFQHLSKKAEGLEQEEGETEPSEKKGIFKKMGDRLAIAVGSADFKSHKKMKYVEEVFQLLQGEDASYSQIREAIGITRNLLATKEVASSNQKRIRFEMIVEKLEEALLTIRFHDDELVNKFFEEALEKRVEEASEYTESEKKQVWKKRGFRTAGVAVFVVGGDLMTTFVPEAVAGVTGGEAEGHNLIKDYVEMRDEGGGEVLSDRWEKFSGGEAKQGGIDYLKRRDAEHLSADIANENGIEITRTEVASNIRFIVPEIKGLEGNDLENYEALKYLVNDLKFQPGQNWYAIKPDGAYIIQDFPSDYNGSIKMIYFDATGNQQEIEGTTSWLKDQIDQTSDTNGTVLLKQIPNVDNFIIKHTAELKDVNLAMEKFDEIPDIKTEVEISTEASNLIFPENIPNDYKLALTTFLTSLYGGVIPSNLDINFSEPVIFTTGDGKVFTFDTATMLVTDANGATQTLVDFNVSASENNGGIVSITNSADPGDRSFINTFENGTASTSTVYDIGEGQANKYLDHALHRSVIAGMSDDQIKALAEDETQDSIEAARQLNVTANFRELLTGSKSIAGVKATELNGVVSWDESGGKLVIQDQQRFNGLVEQMMDRSSAKITSESDALAWVDNVSKERWQEMINERLQEINDTETRTAVVGDYNADENVVNAEHRVFTESMQAQFGEDVVINPTEIGNEYSGVVHDYGGISDLTISGGKITEITVEGTTTSDLSVTVDKNVRVGLLNAQLEKVGIESTQIENISQIAQSIGLVSEKDAVLSSVDADAIKYLTQPDVFGNNPTTYNESSPFFKRPDVAVFAYEHQYTSANLSELNHLKSISSNLTAENSVFNNLPPRDAEQLVGFTTAHPDMNLARVTELFNDRNEMFASGLGVEISLDDYLKIEGDFEVVSGEVSDLGEGVILSGKEGPGLSGVKLFIKPAEGGGLVVFDTSDLSEANTSALTGKPIGIKLDESQLPDDLHKAPRNLAIRNEVLKAVDNDIAKDAKDNIFGRSFDYSGDTKAKLMGVQMSAILGDDNIPTKAEFIEAVKTATGSKQTDDIGEMYNTIFAQHEYNVLHTTHGDPLPTIEARDNETLGQFMDRTMVYNGEISNIEPAEDLTPRASVSIVEQRLGGSINKSDFNDMSANGYKIQETQSGGLQFIYQHSTSPSDSKVVVTLSRPGGTGDIMATSMVYTANGEMIADGPNVPLETQIPPEDLTPTKIIDLTSQAFRDLETSKVYNSIDNDTIKGYFNAHLDEIKTAQTAGHTFSYDESADVLTIANTDGEVVNTITVDDARQDEALLTDGEYAKPDGVVTPEAVSSPEVIPAVTGHQISSDRGLDMEGFNLSDGKQIGVVYSEEAPHSIQLVGNWTDPDFNVEHYTSNDYQEIIRQNLDAHPELIASGETIDQAQSSYVQSLEADLKKLNNELQAYEILKKSNYNVIADHGALRLIHERIDNIEDNYGEGIIDKSAIPELPQDVLANMSINYDSFEAGLESAIANVTNVDVQAPVGGSEQVKVTFKYDGQPQEITIPKAEANTQAKIQTAMERYIDNPTEPEPSLEPTLSDDDIVVQIENNNFENILKLTNLTPEVARLLAEQNNGLNLSGLTSLSPEAAEALGSHSGILVLNGLTNLELDVAEALSNHSGTLMLNGLTSLTPDVVEALGGCKNLINFNGLTEIDEATATALAGDGRIIGLNGLTSLSPEVAEALAGRKGFISLNGLTEIDKATATALAVQDGELSLNGLTSLSPEAATALVKHEGYVTLDGLTSIDKATATALASNNTSGMIYLSNLTSITSIDEPTASIIKQAVSDSHIKISRNLNTFIEDLLNSNPTTIEPVITTINYDSFEPGLNNIVNVTNVDVQAPVGGSEQVKVSFDYNGTSQEITISKAEADTEAKIQTQMEQHIGNLQTSPEQPIDLSGYRLSVKNISGTSDQFGENIYNTVKNAINQNNLDNGKVDVNNFVEEIISIPEQSMGNLQFTQQRALLVELFNQYTVLRNSGISDVGFDISEQNINELRQIVTRMFESDFINSDTKNMYEAALNHFAEYSEV